MLRVGQRKDKSGGSHGLVGCSSQKGSGSKRKLAVRREDTGAVTKPTRGRGERKEAEEVS